jgi:hypothetical protein
MADAKSGAYENLVLDHVFANATWAAISGGQKIALSRADPTEDGSGLDEPNAGSGYARVQTTDSDWSAASGGSLSNSNIISFGTATGGAQGWGEITHFATYGSATGEPGTLYYYGTLSSSKTVGSGDVAQFAVGAFVVKEL